MYRRAKAYEEIGELEKCLEGIFPVVFFYGFKEIYFSFYRNLGTRGWIFKWLSWKLIMFQVNLILIVLFYFVRLKIVGLCYTLFNYLVLLHILIKSKHMLIQQNFDLKGEIIIFHSILMPNLLCNFYFVRHIYKKLLYPDCKNLSWGQNELFLSLIILMILFI